MKFISYHHRTGGERGKERKKEREKEKIDGLRLSCNLMGKRDIEREKSRERMLREN